MKKIMILGASALQIPAIKKAKEMNLFVIAVDMDPYALGFSYADANEVVSTTDTENVLKAAVKHNIDAIITIASDRPMVTIARVAKELGLISISPETSIKATNKYEMRKAFEINDVPIPKFFKVKDLIEYSETLEKMDGKVIVKPVDNSGSRGITLLESRNELIVNKVFQFAMINSLSNDVLVEEYMNGPEVSVESITINGESFVLAITDKITTGAPHFVELGHSEPSLLSKKIQEQIKEITIKAIKALEIVNGPSHTEIIVTSSGPKIVELGARMGGDNITTHLVPLSTGIDMLEATIKISLGLKPSLIKKQERGAAIRYFNFYKGKIRNLSYNSDIILIDYVKDFVINLKANDFIRDIESSSDRVGYVICVGKNAEEAIARCEGIIKKIYIEYENN
jgi:biotin carboxylase